MAKHEMGEQTIIAKEQIHSFNSNISQVNVKKQFRDGVIDRIYKIGYTGDRWNTWEIIDFICTKFQEHDIQMVERQKDNTRTNITNWLSDNGHVPNDSEQSRPNVYKLCFALEMDAYKTEDFFLKHYLCRPFNFKDHRECVYYFCLNTHRTYSDAERLIAIIETLNPENVNKNEETRKIGAALSSITEEVDFLNEMPKYIYDKSEQRKTVTDKIIELEKECKKIANIDGRGSLLRAIYYDEQRSIGNKFLSRQKLLDEEVFPDYISTNFPMETTLSDIINHKNVSNDRCRKMLILLYFYKFYGERYNSSILNGVFYTEVDFSQQYENFEMSLDELLNECGFVELYYRNPYDEFILSCAKKTDPLFEFRTMINLG